MWYTIGVIDIVFNQRRNKNDVDRIFNDVACTMGVKCDCVIYQ
nr:MAG TPA: hypothetical protein [Caudoviricetes sp.]